MKKYCILILFIGINVIAYAQQNYQDIIYLKNGSIIRGMIIEQLPEKSVKIETKDKKVYVFQKDEIERLIKEPIKGNSSIKNDSSCVKKKYLGIVELGYAFGVDYYNINFLKLNVINGYRINPYFSVGIGAGLRYYFEGESAIIPLFLDFRTNIIDKKVSPYLALGCGYSFNATNSFEGVGLLFNPTAGIRFKMSKKSSINVGIGYELQKYDAEYPKSSEAISINVGISF